MYALKLELKLNHKQKTVMAQHAGFARLVYNYGLSLYSQIDHKHYKGGVTKKLGAIKKVLTNVTKQRPEFAWMNTLSSRVYQNALLALGQALTRFFKGLAAFPVMKRKKDGDSFTVDNSNGLIAVQAGKRIKIPTLGIFRLKEPVPFTCASQTFTISRGCDRWFVSFMIRAQKVPPIIHPIERVGIDLGVKKFATLSDGTTYDAPSSLRAAKTKLAKEQWRNRNKQLGNRRLGVKASNNAKKYFQRSSKRHARITNIRKDFLQKTTTEISRKYYRIRIEDLNVRGMMANQKLADAIGSLGLYEFRRQLVYKSPMFGTVVELVDRWYPSSKMCSRCQHIQPMRLSDRVFVCQNCGHVDCRDHNASVNLENAPDNKVRQALPEFTPVDKQEPTPLVEAGNKHQCPETSGFV